MQLVRSYVRRVTRKEPAHYIAQFQLLLVILLPQTSPSANRESLHTPENDRFIVTISIYPLSSKRAKGKSCQLGSEREEEGSSFSRPRQEDETLTHTDNSFNDLLRLRWYGYPACFATPGTRSPFSVRSCGSYRSFSAWLRPSVFLHPFDDIR